VQRRRSRVIVLEKASSKDPIFELERIIASMTKRLREQFVKTLTRVRDAATLKKMERLLLAGRIKDAIELGKEHYTAFANDWVEVYIKAAKDTAGFVGREIGIIAVFDQMNMRALAAMQQNTLRLVRELTRQQAEAAREAILEGVAEGWNPRQTARAVRDSIGLTAKQERAVLNFERMLRENDATSLTRRLRDRRFDPTIRSALEREAALDAKTIKTMVDRYRERYVKYRSEVIARTEALRSVHQGNEEMYRQAFDSGELSPDELVRTWNTAKDSRVRDTHDFMHRQERKIGQPFTTGGGVSIMYPGDPSAPAEETVQCRCVLSTRFKIDTDPLESF